MASYGEPHRRYHTLDHLHAVFAMLDRHAAGAADPARLAFACWYHDIVYRPGDPQNEAASAARAAHELALLGADPALIARVRALILATASHQTAAADADAMLFLDADFSILGAAPDSYRRYADAVRQEYSSLGEEAWRRGRIAFLEKTLAQPCIFRTATFETAYGAQARTSIEEELRTLRGAPDPLPR